MELKEKYSIEIQDIQSDLDILMRKQIYEVEKRPGVPSVSKVGERLCENLNKLLYKIENDKPGSIEEFAEYFRDNFD